MYLVTVINRATGETAASMAFPFGKWSEIGFWLDAGYLNDDRYEVRINFGTFGG